MVKQMVKHSSENGAKNLGKVALYQLSYFRKSMFRNCECKGN